ncbi:MULTISPECIES: AAA family ATPase [Paenibacillus]|uniref:AAA family ATPase n=1 Tax=Paenibacillus TaxID=44249 RepID=UPI00096E8EAD|nr:MoxR family ATPase [Paenibacillus odorifer]MEC0133485.1 MoxR family ATPase [Paenibacillus odorifer]MEC0224804.1 MoxR family ATPase [Paenibacillus odorifer]OMC96626.1 ATP-binding protein [Paenibacillus odorifer]OMD03841.1 ATP-binding protein [Paenibacillus odorifer]OMD15874.1 ATP-binding protein [Paenibacillus odorifer]
MNLATPVTPIQLMQVLLNVSVIRPVFIWGAPGIGKSSLVEAFADQVGLPCVSLLGSQLAPEDIIGVPQIVNGKSQFCPPKMIARDEPYCLFLDELNACSQEVQKAFYSLIHERRIGDYHLPEGSIVIGAGNRAQDSAIVKPMSSALINRMFHIQLNVSFQNWISWAYEHSIHPMVIEYLELRPDHLWSAPPKTEEPFSTPRSWHMLSDALHEFGDDVNVDTVGILANGSLTPSHATQFRAFYKNLTGKYELNQIIDGKSSFPTAPEDRDLLYFLAQSLRAQIIKELPPIKDNVRDGHRQFAHTVKKLIKDLSVISFEIAQLVVAKQEQSDNIPDWLMVEIVRDLPRLAIKERG